MVDATKILNAIQQAGTEIAEQGIKGTEQIISTVITGQELVGDAKAMSDEEMAKAKAEDEKKKQEEMAKMKNIPGRNVEAEVKQVIEEKKSEEDQKEKEFLENIKRQREEEEAERNNFVSEPGNAKREQAKHSMSPNKKKGSQTAAPNMSTMSATSEFKGGKID
jgi:hypothetical protein